MINADYVVHDVTLAFELLVLGITSLPASEYNHRERIVMRATLTLLEMLLRNIRGTERKIKK